MIRENSEMVRKKFRDKCSKTLLLWFPPISVFSLNMMSLGYRALGL